VKPEFCQLADKSPLGIEFILGALATVAVIAIWMAAKGWLGKVLYMLIMWIRGR
jgi:hypothetical protein